MNYNETLLFLNRQLPMFQRDGAPAYKADLAGTFKLATIFNNPEKNFPSIHIAGTNGKGSVSNIIASILQEAGFKVGLFTSPHLVDFRERIRVNGDMIPEQFVVNFVAECQNKHLFDCNINPSFFELTFAMAMDYFSSQTIDIAVVEVGMGGRLDSTNIVRSNLSVITNIGYDHTTFLGDTIEKIAVEKAGIIKENIPVIIGKKQNDTSRIFTEIANKRKSILKFATDLIEAYPDDFGETGKINIKSGNNNFQIHSPLKGIYQIENITTALAALKILSSISEYNQIFEPKNIENGIKNIFKNTHFQGRWQILGTNPLIICDTGHNVDGLTISMGQISTMKYEKLHMVIGVVADKDIDTLIKLMPEKANYYFCSPNIPRGLAVQKLAEKALINNRIGRAYGSVKEALNAAKNSASNKDLIFIGGSTFVVAEVV